ncbi:hypothetical protein V5T82_14115 [Magnetovibrio sp. PR-2]|uniref:hypothetical protein n=1 Tax=Magnetovibrio sp. PR-2 TaxID=3120356 RepID=UPI002FCE6696
MITYKDNNKCIVCGSTYKYKKTGKCVDCSIKKRLKLYHELPNTIEELVEYFVKVSHQTSFMSDHTTRVLQNEQWRVIAKLKVCGDLDRLYDVLTDSENEIYAMFREYTSYSNYQTKSTV